MTLRNTLIEQGATLAADGIPLHFGDLAGEYHAALQAGVLLLRSHEGRLELTGRDRLSLLHRISTNDMENLSPGEGRATLFTNANARILDRAVVFNRGEHALAMTEPGRGPALLGYLQRNIFFNDEVRVAERTPETAQFALHGPRVDAVLDSIDSGITALPLLHSRDIRIGNTDVFLARNKPLEGAHWTLIVPAIAASEVWNAVLEAGQPHGLRPAGSLTYNTLRIRAGRPAVGRELSQEYIPLEVGLWDEVSFGKGCYTGQEIIARMESRQKLAKVMVRLRLSQPVGAPAGLFHQGRSAGTLTSSVTTPDEEHFGIGVVRTGLAHAGEVLAAGENETEAVVLGYAGTPPPMAVG